ncbi:MAG: ROK family protein [Selenomonadaceae bacterium]|nr:ROK family protein [Selenomonadaceae bacterium]
MKKFLAIDVGGTFTKFAVMSGVRSFKITKQDKISTPKKSHEQFLDALADIYNTYDDVEGIALSSTGIIDSVRGICLMSNNLPFLSGHCIAEELQAMCGVPVTVENDANCAALAEVKSGCLVDVNNAFVLVFGTSVGGAFVCNKEIYRGAHFCAGEVAMTLKSINSVVSEKNFYANDIGALALMKSCAKTLGMPLDEVAPEMVFDLIDENDDDMLDCLYKYAAGVAVKIFNLQMLFDPERIAIGGGVSSRQSFIDAIQDKVDELYEKIPAEIPRPEIVPCKIGNDANLFGALYRHLKK